MKKSALGRPTPSTTLRLTRQPEEMVESTGNGSCDVASAFGSATNRPRQRKPLYRSFVKRFTGHEAKIPILGYTGFKSPNASASSSRAELCGRLSPSNSHTHSYPF